VKDAGHVLSSPGRWKKKQWAEFGISVGAIAATYTLDSTIRDAIQRNRGGAMDTTAHYLEPFGAAYSFGVIAGFYIGGVSAHDQNARETAVDAISATLIASGIITPALKIVTGRGRPSQYGDPSHFQPFSGDASFPSGHTTQAFVVASVIASHYDQGWVKGLSYGLAATVGFSRMVHDQHWASDVLTGALIGTAVGKEVVRFNKTARLPKTARYSVVPVVGPRGYGATLVASF
jgi:membrane-associated phospholipid phosphatase